MNRETANVLLLLVGGALVKIAVDGSYVRYVKPGLLPYLLAAALVIIVLGIAAIAHDIRRGQAPDADEHRHSTRPYWMLLIPAAMILFVAPPALRASSVGSSTAQQTMAAPDKTAFPPLPDGPAPEVPLLEVIGRAARDRAGSLDDRQITTAGFVLATRNDGRDGLDLARILIICCAADARTIRVHLDGNLGDIPEGTWLSVTGDVQPDTATADTGYTPTLTVTDVRRIPAPANTYAY
ncbi:TIGR03943 family putative permease subunit [Rhodococcus sp. JS3073]|uniref:TIGR03943 family putative permease subunit n=1 Tax=Rhodococcus sp. JS3073 TaxID=3002901 RepID=UPI00228582FD|nr:TIGR03943 family protein [Rhodococcus sp. JS3073]WAM19436.1 TIGR03943 family protein [Rhodococcus sp. JS3073]